MRTDSPRLGLPFAVFLSAVGVLIIHSPMLPVIHATLSTSGQERGGRPTRTPTSKPAVPRQPAVKPNRPKASSASGNQTNNPLNAEASLWERIKNSTNLEDFRAYLLKYSNGKFAVLAQRRIKELEAAIERTYWESIKNSDSQDDFRAYLKKYPDGMYADLARNQINVLVSAAREEADRKEEEAKKEESRQKGKPSPSKSDATSEQAANTSPMTGPTIGNSSRLRQLHDYEFVVPTIDAKGKEKSRAKGHAQSFVENLGGGVTLEMVKIPGGSFTMGSSSKDLDQVKKWLKLKTPLREEVEIAQILKSEGPQHAVTVPSFYMGKYEVTQAQWRAVAQLPRVNRDLEPNPSKFKDDNRPVEQVSWDDAVEFCQRLSKATKLEYRLPSEAEWEYACRAGTTTPFAFGEGLSLDLVNYAGDRAYADKVPNDELHLMVSRQGTLAVGAMSVANGFGLYDMHGNVWEWCLDPWHDTYKGAPNDGSAWNDAGDERRRVMRGGSRYDRGVFSRSANRGWDDYQYVGELVGFRVVVTLAQTQ